MGEKDERFCDGEKKSKGAEKEAADGGTGGGDGGNKEDGGLNTIVLKLDLHCDGCAKKVKRSIKNYDGVEQVKVDAAGGKLTVKGNVDANWLRDKVEQKTKKRVELIVSSQPKKDAGGEGDKKPGDKVKEKKKPVDKVDDKMPDRVKENKSEEKVEKKKHDENKEELDKKPKEIQGGTIVLKIPLHCDGCAQKIRRIIKKIDGVENVTIDNDKDLITLEGTMDVKEFLPYLKEKLKRNVDIVSPMKDGGSRDGEKKGKESGGGSGTEKKEKKVGGGGDDKKEKAVEGDKEKKEKVTSGGGGEKKKEKEGGGDGEKKKEKEDGSNGEKKKEKATGGEDKKDKGGDSESKDKKEKEVNTKGGGGSKKEKEGSDGGGGGKKENAAGGGEKKEKTNDGGKKQVNETKDVGNNGDKIKDKLDESKFEINKMEYQGYGTPYTHYGIPQYNQSYSNQDYGIMHTMYNNPYQASTSYVTEYNNQPYYQQSYHQPYHHLHHHFQQPQAPPPPPPTYLPPPQDQMFSDENPNACSMM